MAFFSRTPRHQSEPEHDTIVTEVAPAVDNHPRIGAEFDAVFAAVGPLRINSSQGAFGGAMGRKRKKKAPNANVEAWQLAMISFDRDGPGFVGYSLDLQADLGGMTRLRVEHFDKETNRWVENESEMSGKVITQLNGPYQKTDELFISIVRGLNQIGEMAFLPIDWKGGLRYLAVMPHTIEPWGRDPNNKKLPTHYIVKLSPDAEEGDEGMYFKLPRQRYFRIWEPDHEYQMIAHSDWRRVVPDIRRYRTLQRTIHRAASSQLVSAGLLRFEGDPKDMGEAAKPRDKNSESSGGRVRVGHLGGTIRSLIDAGKKHLDDVDENLTSGAMPHPVVTKGAIEHIPLGQQLDKRNLDAKKDALEDIARSAPLPRSVIVEGLGSSERQLNNYLQDETMKQTAVIPAVMRACQGLTLAFFHPLMRAPSTQFNPAAFGQPELSIDDFRIGYDDSPLEIAADESEAVAKGIELGALQPRAYAKAIGWEEYELVPGTPEWEAWLALHGSGTAEPEAATLEPATEPQALPAVTAAPWYAELNE